MLPCPSAGPGQTADSLSPPPACLPQPVGMDARAYWRASLPTVLLVCLCLVQAFGYRLRRVIAAFYFPKVNSQTTLPLNTCTRVLRHTRTHRPCVPPCVGTLTEFLLLPAHPFSERRSGFSSSTMSYSGREQLSLN